VCNKCTKSIGYNHNKSAADNEFYYCNHVGGEVEAYHKDCTSQLKKDEENYHRNCCTHE
jgi:tetratricopeptide (TPR) repeat protein